MTHVVEELHQRVGRQLSVILDDLIVGKYVDALHLIQTFRGRVTTPLYWEYCRTYSYIKEKISYEHSCLFASRISTHYTAGLETS